MASVRQSGGPHCERDFIVLCSSHVGGRAVSLVHFSHTTDQFSLCMMTGNWLGAVNSGHEAAHRVLYSAACGKYLQSVVEKMIQRPRRLFFCGVLGDVTRCVWWCPKVVSMVRRLCSWRVTQIQVQKDGVGESIRYNSEYRIAAPV